MPVYGGQPVGVVHVDHLPVSPVEHRHARHIPGGHAPHGLARHALRLDVDSVMEMVRPQLPEVRAQQQGEVEGRSETVFGRMLLRPSAQCGEERKRQCKFAHHSSPSTSSATASAPPSGRSIFFTFFNTLISRTFRTSRITSFCNASKATVPIHVFFSRLYRQR